MRTIRRVAVLGAGTMGSRIAAHFANAGVPSLLLDVAGQPNRNAPALQGIQNALKQRPGGFFTDEKAALVEAGNFEDDLDKLADCDWIIEAIVENLDAKRALWHKVDAARKPGAILSTNTSGIPLAKISEGFSPELPPPLPRHALLQSAALSASDGADSRAGNRSARFSRTSNSSPTAASAKAWCAPRTRPTSSPTASAVFWAAPSAKAMVEEDFSIEEVDALTGPLIGVPEQRQLPPARSGGPGCLGLRRNKSVRSCSQRSVARSLPAARFRKENDRAKVARRQDRPGLLQARGQAIARSWRWIGKRSNTSRSESRASPPSKPRATSKIWASACAPCSAPTIAPAGFCGRS